MSDFNLAERADVARERLETLRHERGAALLDDKPIAHDPIIQVEQEIDALGEAEAEAVRRQREAAAVEIAATRKRLVGEIEQYEIERQAQLHKAQMAAHDLVAAMTAAMMAGSNMGIRFSQLGKASPMALSPSAFGARIGDRLGAILGTMSSFRTHMGAVKWRGTYRLPTDDWAKQEAAEMASEIATLKKD